VLGLMATSPGKYKLMTTSARSRSARPTSSLSTSPPAGMVTAPRPRNVTARSVLGTMPLPSPRTATWVDPTSTGSMPYAFDRRTRTLLPPRLIRTNCRMVAPFTFCAPSPAS
jgi:hypothetical protein